MTHRITIISAAAAVALGAAAVGGMAIAGVFTATAENPAPSASSLKATDVTVKVANASYNGLDAEFTLDIGWPSAAGSAVAQVAPPTLTNAKGEQMLASEGEPRNASGSVQWVSFHDLPASFTTGSLTLKVESVSLGSKAEVAAARSTVSGPWSVSAVLPAASNATTLPISASSNFGSGQIVLTSVVQTAKQTIVLGQQTGLIAQATPSSEVWQQSTLVTSDGKTLPCEWSVANSDGTIELRFARTSGAVTLRVPAAAAGGGTGAVLAFEVPA